MKFFYISVFVFALMIGITFYNTVFINDFCKETMAALANIDLSGAKDPLTEVKDISDTALSRLKIAELTVPREKIETVKNYFDLLIIEVKKGEFNEFEKTRQLLTNQLTEIMELEKPKLSNII